MAAAVEHNGDGRFGGAFVVIPPAEGGDPIETLILDSHQDATQFWSLLQAKAALMVQELEEKKRLTGAFGGRR